MPIRSRFIDKDGKDVDVTERYILPEPLLKLFGQVLPMGSVIERSQFFRDVLPKYDHEEFKVKMPPYEFSVRPAWRDYHSSPGTHLIVIGHILFCHVLQEYSWYYQPSVRLFSEDPRIRMRQFEQLVERAKHNKDAYFSHAKQVVSG